MTTRCVKKLQEALRERDEAVRERDEEIAALKERARAERTEWIQFIRTNTYVLRKKFIEIGMRDPATREIATKHMEELNAKWVKDGGAEFPSEAAREFPSEAAWE